MHVKTEHLYRILLNPKGFVRYLYTRNPIVDCGLTWDDEFNPLGQHISNQMNELTGRSGTVYVTDVVTSFHQWAEPYIKVTAINPRWVRLFNRSLRRIGGGEPQSKIFPVGARGDLAAALDIKLPDSPFDGADTTWPGYDPNDPEDFASRPYDIEPLLDDWQLCKVQESRGDEWLWVHLTFRVLEYKKLLVFKVPSFFPLHCGFENRVGGWVQEIKVTQARPWRKSQWIITFRHGHKLAIPAPLAILDKDSPNEAYDNIPF